MHYASTSRSRYIGGAFVLFMLGACSKKTDPPQATRAAAAAPAAPAQHAPRGARPGSREDWCGEHQVPESLCTRCNPSLIAAFKATGDWCAEHRLPESQCFACNPDLKIHRPPRSGEARP